MLARLQTLNRTHLAIGGIVLAVVFFFSVNLLSSILFTTARLDLTEDARFTISEGTKDVLSGIEEPVSLRFYASRQLQQLGPFYSLHVGRVRDMLDEYARLAGGKLRIEEFDPQPFSPEEDLAVADGLQGIAIDTEGTQIFFGLSGRNSTDDSETIGFLAPEQAAFLEYDLTRLIHDLANPEKPAAALIGDLPLQGDQLNQFQPWTVLESMRQFYEVRSLQGAFDTIADDIQVLILAQPNTLDEQALYAIDQFVLRGGRILAFVDPLSETLAARSPASLDQPGAASVLAPLLTAWGVEVPAATIVGDLQSAMRVRAYHQGREVTTHYLPWLELTAANVTQGDVITANLERLNLRTSGHVRHRDGATTTFEPLVATSAEAMEIDVVKLRFAPDPVGLLNAFQAAGTPFTLAARVSGTVASAFPDGPPEAAADAAARDGHLTESQAPLNLVIVADSDFLANETWVQAGNLLGQRYAVPIANNGDLAVNALDHLAGSQGLISLRGRGLAVRPFEVLEAMAVEAENQFRDKEKTLLDRIEETQEKIRALQTEEQESGIILTAAQQETIDDFRAEMIALRQELRSVQLALRQDVEALETRLRVINIWVMPLLVGLVAIGLAAYRRRRAARFQAMAGE